jgi:prepilin-type N-terminal cleavage/methylation domain-containing protein
MRQGVSLPEMVTVLGIVAVVTALAVPNLVGWADRIAVARAAGDIATFYQTARMSAVFRSQRVRVELGYDTLRAVFEGPEDSVFLTRSGPARHGVGLFVSRPVVRFQPNGLGLGASNTKLVLRRGAAVESLTVSRLGRLKRWP